MWINWIDISMLKHKVMYVWMFVLMSAVSAVCTLECTPLWYVYCIDKTREYKQKREYQKEIKLSRNKKIRK